MAAYGNERHLTGRTARRATSAGKRGKHLFFFDDDQPDKLGDHPGSKGGKPLYLPRDSQLAIFSPTQVSSPLSLAIATIAITYFLSFSILLMISMISPFLGKLSFKKTDLFEEKMLKK